MYSLYFRFGLSLRRDQAFMTSLTGKKLSFSLKLGLMFSSSQFRFGLRPHVLFTLGLD
jgi:hypothetical protein